MDAFGQKGVAGIGYAVTADNSQRSGVRMELDRIREVVAMLGKLRSDIETRVQPIVTASAPCNAKEKEQTTRAVPSCDLHDELERLRGDAELVANDYESLLNRIRL